MKLESQMPNAAELSQPQILEELRLGGVGNYLFESPLDEENKEGIAKLLCEAEKLNPGALTANDFVVRMWGYWQIGEKEKSLHNANKALNLNPDNLLALNFIVYLLADAGRYIKAREALKHLGRVSEKSASKKKERGNTRLLGLAFLAT